MAILSRQPLGKMKGKYGSSVVQRRFGRTVVSLRPDHYDTKSEKVKTQRKEFALKVMFAKTVNLNPLLIECWKHCQIKSISGYHKALSYNSRIIKNDVPTKNNIITPPYHLKHSENMVSLKHFNHKFSDNSINFEYQFLESDDGKFKPPYHCAVVLFLLFSDGKTDRVTPLAFDEYIESENINSDGIMSVAVNFEEKQKELLKLYRLMRGYFALVKPDYSKPKDIIYSYTKFFEENLKDYYNSNSEK